jgi:hypothetical protein
MREFGTTSEDGYIKVVVHSIEEFDLHEHLGRRFNREDDIDGCG